MEYSKKTMIENKKCPKCNKIKSANCFYKSNQTISGLACYCIECRKILDREYHERPEIKEAHIKRCREYRKNHLEQERINHKNYKQNHRKEINEHNREYAKSHRDVYNKRQNKWLNSHLEKRQEYNNKRRAFVSGAKGAGVTSEEWLALLNKYGNKCLSCGETKKRLTMDHVVPISCGGAHDLGNIQPLCKACNSSKGTKTIDYRQNYCGII